MSEYEYEIIVSQPYQNCEFSAGFVKGHPVDTLFLRLEREEELTILLRPDEMAAIAYCASGILWSHLELEVAKKEEE